MALSKLVAVNRSPVAGNPARAEADPESSRLRPLRAAAIGVPGGVQDDFAARFETPSAHAVEELFLRPRSSRRAHWSIIWADLMMTMFILFLVMYATKDARNVLHSEGIGGDAGKVVGVGAPLSVGGGLGGPQGPTLERSMSRIYDLSVSTVAKENLGTFASVNLVPDQAVRIILTGDLLFDPGRAELKSSAKRSLRHVADLIRRTPYVVNVVGHTDDKPVHTASFPSNWELSMKRASVVARYLIEDLRLPANRFYISGHSSLQPVEPNDSPAHRAANRRVEIVITKEMPVAS